MNQCSTAGCQKKVRARGLCGRHYQQLCKAQEPKILVGCKVCGRAFETRAKKPASYCSAKCRCSVSLPKRIANQQRTNRTIQCARCQQPFVVVQSKPDRKYCSRACYAAAYADQSAAKTKKRLNRPCERCGKIGTLSRGMCCACYQHHLLWRPENMVATTCRTCGKEFTTPKQRNRIYCSTKCYVKSDAFCQARERYSLETAARRIKRECLECGKPMLLKPCLGNINRETPRGRKVVGRRLFCSRACYRKYFAARFDRFAQTEADIDLKGMSWDEFLAQESLPCPVSGCDWIGDHLGIHVNHAHGITADELKERLGFNRNSGLMSAPAWADRSALAVAQGKGNPDFGQLAVTGDRQWDIRPEGREHLRRARAMSTTPPSLTDSRPDAASADHKIAGLNK